MEIKEKKKRRNYYNLNILLIILEQDMSEYKKCFSCKEIKRLEDFSKRKDSLDGRRNKCRECMKKYFLTWKNKNKIKKNIPDDFKYCGEKNGCGNLKQKIYFNFSKYTKDGLKSYCKECEKKNKALDWQKNKNKYKIKAKIWRENNKNEIRKNYKKYREDNKEKLKIKKLEYISKNKNKLKERKREFYKNNKNIFYINKILRRERKNKVCEKFNKKLIDIVFCCFNKKCFKCGNEKNLVIDHHRPLSKGNALTLSNAVILCKGCNSSKGAKDPELFYGKELCLKIDIMLLLIEYIYS